jgi:hypothetical protein
MVQHALDRGYEVVGVCREESVGKLAGFKSRITVIPGATDNRAMVGYLLVVGVKIPAQHQDERLPGGA